jgi:hypothetical protein
MFKQDKTSFGIQLGLGSPLAVFGVLYLIIFLVVKIGGMEPFMTQNSLIILSVVLNFIWIRYYFNTLKFQETGKGILLVTFVLIMIFFLLNRQFESSILPGLKAI